MSMVSVLAVSYLHTCMSLCLICSPTSSASYIACCPILIILCVGYKFIHVHVHCRVHACNYQTPAICNMFSTCNRYLFSHSLRLATYSVWRLNCLWSSWMCQSRRLHFQGGLLLDPKNWTTAIIGCCLSCFYSWLWWDLKWWWGQGGRGECHHPLCGEGGS